MVPVIEHMDEWQQQFETGWLAHYHATGNIDWKLYNKPRNKTAPAGPAVDLAGSRLVLISSAGGYLVGQDTPFDAFNLLGDYTIRLFPVDASPDAIDYAQDHFDHQYVEADMQVLLPTGHLQAMVAAGTIGSLAANVISFSGYQPDASRVATETAPAILQAAQAMQATAALLVPS